jgi:uncharacterized MAPEG superfamily protein
MTIAEVAVFAAVLLYLLTLAPVKAFGFRDFRNSSPRDPTFYEPPLRARAFGAHVNGVETFPFFAAAVLLAEFRHCHQGTVDALAAVFVVVRLIFVLLYIGDRPTLRTLAWNLGFFVNTAIFFLPAIERVRH